MSEKIDKKQETRKKMLAAASRNFREFGFSGVGVDGLAKAADVTSGAFYAHFGSKAAAFDAALVDGLDEVIDGIHGFQSKHGSNWMVEFIDYYLGRSHRSKLSNVCAMATLTPEVIRSDAKVHTIYEKKMSVIVDLLARGLNTSSDESARTKAWAVLATLIGGLNVTLAMKNTKAADEVATATKTAALKIAGRTRRVN